MRVRTSVRMCELGERVFLSEAKDHFATLDPGKKILRFAQDDSGSGACRAVK